MRFAAISDIHGNSAALDAVLADIARHGVSEIVNLGDSLSGPLDPAGTADRLLRFGFPTVIGNHDRALIDRRPEGLPLWEQWTYPRLESRHLDWVRALPPTLEWNGIFLFHGSPLGDEDNWLHDRKGRGGMREKTLTEIADRAGDLPNRLLLSGRTHLPRMVRLPDDRCLVNSGTVGCPAYRDPRPRVPTVAMTGAPDARYAICELINDAWHVTLRSIPYNSDKLITCELAHGAEDWSRALESGWTSI